MSDFTDLYTLSPLQEGMLFHSLYAEGAGAYTVQNLAVFTGHLDIDAYEKAWQKVISRHTILRTGFLWEEVEKPLQVVFEKVSFSIGRMDWSLDPQDVQAAKLEQLLQEEKEKGFDLSEAPLMRVTLIKKAENQYQLIWSFHHLLLDGWSSPIVYQEVIDYYQAYLQGKELRLPQPRPFREYISWIRKQDLNSAEQFWRQFLQGMSHPTPLPYQQQSAGHSNTSAGTLERDLPLSIEATEALNRMARTYKLTMNTIVQGAWAILLQRLSGEEAVTYGVTVSGRPSDLQGVEQMVGMFINTLPMKVQVEAERSAAEWLTHLQDTQAKVRQYEYASLVQIQGWSEVPRGSSLFDSIFVFENYPLGETEAENNLGFTVSDVDFYQTMDHPLTVVGMPGEQLKLKVIFDQSQFETSAMELLLRQLAMILEGMVQEPEQRLSELSLISEAERQQLLVEWNQTAVDYPRERTVHELFAEVAAHYPNQRAVVIGEESITYAELDQRSNQLAHYLRKQGVGADTLVGICVERSIEMIVGLLGILKAGGAYVPLDPTYPQERLAFMMEDAQLSVLVTQSHLVEQLPATAGKAICLDRDWSEIEQENSDAPANETTAGQVAYVIYTSGSTGTPKGTLVPHRGIVRLVKHNDFVTITEQDVFLQASTVSFDAATFEIWGSLLNGAQLALMPPHLPSLAELGEAIQTYGVTILWLTAGLFTVMVDNHLDSLRGVRHLLAGGDVVSVPHVRKVLQLEGLQVINGYGPTESTTFTCCYPISQVPDSMTTLPIGRPIKNTTVYVLDPQMQPVPVGVPGELYIGGDGLAIGYLNRPELTEERFVHNPFAADPEARLYRTGDLVRYLPDGVIEFIGRIDQQVKIRGFRIELGEIEEQLRKHPAVREAVVIAREDKPGDKRLVAYVTTHEQQAADTAQLTGWIKDRLPDYMVPAAVVSLDELPLTPNGKVDRRALPAPDWGTLSSSEAYVAPRNPMEELVCNIWSQVLGVETVGIHSNFFELGGHSLLATQTLSRLREVFGIHLPMRTLFESATVAELCEQIKLMLQGDTGVATTPITQASRTEHLPLSYAQQRLWFFDRFMPESAVYNIPTAIRLDGALDAQAWEASLQAVIARHESLRTTFSDINGQAIQVIHPQIDWEMGFCDLRHLPAEHKEEEVQRLASMDADQPFNLSQGPLLRASLIRTEEETHIFLLNIHHIISDGWSMGILMNELLTIYEATLNGETADLPALPIQYADYSVWQRDWLQGEVLEKQLSYWKEKVSGCEPLLALPTDRPRPAMQTYEGSRHTVTFSADLSEQLQALCREENATLFMTLLAAFQTLLYRYTGQQDILVGSPVAGRSHQETESLIGFFINTLVMRTDMSEEPTFRELLARVRETALEAYAHQDLPFEKLVDELQLERSLSYTPLFQVMFALQNFQLASEQAAGIRISSYETEQDEVTSKFDITLTMVETTDGLMATFEYNRNLFDQATIERMVEHFRTLLESITADPDESIELLAILPEEESEQLLVEWNGTETAYPRDKTVDQLFHEAASKWQDRPAVVAGEISLSYAELERRANQVANYLRKQGVTAGSLVGISAERSVEMIAGLIGILKAGAAYVPLDPAYPQERLAYMMEDADVSILVTQAHLVEKLPIGERTVICLDRDWSVITQESDQAPANETDSSAAGERLAYVIYTSGSTGTPKGVLTPHCGIVRLVTDTNYVTISEDDVFLQASTVSFDAATFEIWGALLNGAKLVLMPPHLPSLEEIGETIQKHQVTTMWLTAGLFTLLVDHQVEYLRGVRQLLVGGDVVSVPHVRKALTIDGLQIINGYGPTETTTFACCYPVTDLPKQLSSLPIGRPIQNTTVYILDQQQQPVPTGVPGELYIGGDGLALGYLNNPELTEERFVEHPFSDNPEARLYRTGDLVRYLADGTIEFIGRIDNQVKIRGFRIELGEIETALLQHEDVQEAVVMVREDAPGDKRLAAYLVTESKQEIDSIEWRMYLKESLPEYMIPSAFVMMDSLPLTPNGKVDRKALPVPTYSQTGSEAEFVAPATHVETTLAEIWKQVLGAPQVGLYDNFFALGGDSILSIQIVARASQAGLRLSPKQIFEHQTIAELARIVADTASVAGPQIEAEQGLVTGELVLTPIQKWFFEQNQPQPHHWNQSLLLSIRQPVDAAALEQAIAQLLTHHDALRLRFVQENGEWRARHDAETEQVPFFIEDLSSIPASEQVSHIEEIAEGVQASLNLAEGPLMRAVYFDLGAEQDARLLLVVHHLAVDGISWRILLEDLQTAYQQLTSGTAVVLPPKTVAFQAWAEQLTQYADSEALQQEKAYWLSQKPAAAHLPTDYAYDAQTNTQETTKQVTLSLTVEETRALLQDTLSPYRLQMNDVLLTALAKAMNQWTGAHTLSIHLEGHGREEIIEGADISRTVGWFTTMYPVQLHLEPSKTWGDGLKSIKEQLRQIPNKGIGYGILRYLSQDAETVERLRNQAKPQISFNYLGQFDQTISGTSTFNLASESRGSHTDQQAIREHLLDVTGAITGEQLQMTWIYNEQIHSEQTIQTIAAHYMQALREIMAHCQTEEAGGYTPSDFPLARLSQKNLDRYLGTDRTIENVYTLSPLQQGMLFHSLYAEEGGDYVVQLGLTFADDLNLEACEQAWQKVVDRHSILRTFFIWEGMDQPHQVVRKHAAISMEHLDWCHLSAEEQEAAYAAWVEEDRRRNFDLLQPPLMRWTILHLNDQGERAYRMLWSFHHVLLDGWSFPLVLKDWLDYYQAFNQGQEVHVSTAQPFAQYIAWLQRQDLQEAKQYWRTQLQGFHSPTPLGMGKANIAVHQPKTYSKQILSLSQETTEMLQNFARKHHLTLNTLVLGAWALILSRYSGEDEVVFGATGSGRPAELPGVESMVGLFINTLPVRVPLQSQENVMEWLRGLQQIQLNNRQYEYTPLVDIHSWSPIPASESLFDSILVFENYPVDETVKDSEAAVTITEVQTNEQTNYPLTLVADPGKRLTLNLQFEQTRFEPDTIERILSQMAVLLTSMAECPEQLLSEVSFLSESEREQVLHEWNQTEADYPQDLCIHEWFAQQAEKTPDAIAVEHGEQALTYAQLNQRANQLAHYLQKQGTGPDKLVGICVERSIEMIVGILGVMKAGAAYVPIDPAHPLERIAYMLEDTQASLVLTQSTLLSVLPETEAMVICLDGEEALNRLSDEPIDTPDSGVTSRHLAYVIYTSGSTGQPKGVMVEHHSAINMAIALIQAFGVDETSRVLQFTSFSFDVSVSEITMALLSGAALLIEDRDALLPGPELARIIRERRVTTVSMASSVLAALPFEEFPELRTLIVGGESPSRELIDRYAPGRAFFNCYGPTEATVTTTMAQCFAGGATPTIGRPIRNAKVYVLNDQLQPVPVGVPGELYIGGSGLARGYWNRPDLTAERFIQSPFAAEGERLYRTGDLVRYLPDGEIEFIGRIDDQVKIRGYRIELGEIESILRQHPAVKEAVVIAREDQAGDKRLAAYMTAESTTIPASDELTAWLKQTLPSYMVPSGYKWLDTIPLTVNGKVDRRALPAPEWGQATANKVYVAPRNPVEEMVANIYSQVLSVEKVGAHDHFFELGGHSLLATQAISRLREAFGVELPLRALFENATVSSMGAEITTMLAEQSELTFTAITAAERGEHLPLSFAQQRLWFFDRLMPGSALYNIPSATRLQGELNVQAWEQSLQTLIARHESLRTIFTDHHGEAVQVIHPEMDWSLTVTDLRHLGAEEKQAEIEKLAKQDAQQPFDLSQGPLMRASLIQEEETSFIFLFNMHHIVSDGWSMGILMDELITIYEALIKDETPVLPEMAIQYADFAVWQREWLQGEVLDQQLSYWKEKLQGSEPLLALPTDRPRPAEQSYQGALYSAVFPTELLTKLQAMSREEGSTLFMTLLAAFQLLLSRYTGQDDILVGSPVAGRNRKETESLIGFFINTLVMRTDLSGEPSFREVLARVRETALNAYAHQDLPFEKLVDELELERSLSYSPLYQVMFVLQNIPLAAQEFSGLTVLPYEQTQEQVMAKFDLTLTMAEVPDGIMATFEYSTDLFDQSTIVRLVDHFHNLLEEIVKQPDQSVALLPFLGDAERQLVVTDWNETDVPVARDLCVHELVAAVAGEMPEQIAIVSGEQTITYAELNRRANQLAHYLQKQGVSTETLVGICVERSVEMLVGLLGILKAGAAYVPMDPTYPQERLAFMMEDANMPLVLTQDRLRSALEPCTRTLISLDSEWELIAQESEETPTLTVTADHLAYVIYTSGSTGTPKGVEIEHSSLLNLISWHQRTYDVTASSRATQIAGTAFDASVWEIWPYVTKGATLYLPAEEIRLVPEQLRDWLIDCGITTSFLPTPLAENMLALDWPQDTPLRHMLTGGDKLHNYPSASLPFVLVNHYGPTENTVVATAGIVPVQAGQATAPSIGRPIDNVKIYVLDENLQPVPIGVAGEMYIGGGSLARGYLHRPDLTAERFLPNPFTTEPGARMYRTGDLVRYLPDGSIEFIGRADHQVSIRGFRVELGEIETALYGHPAVRENTVIAREDLPGVKRLVAYLVTDPEHSVQASELRTYLKDKLPDYMVPFAFVIMDSLPLTPNGKVDRKALPAPEYSQPELEGEYVAPETAVEQKMADIWQQVLGIETVGIHDNFFELGGDSILSIQIVSRANQAGLRVTPKQLFENQTIAQLSAVITLLGQDAEEMAISAAEQGTLTGALPLTPIQQWFFERDQSVSHHWNQSLLLAVKQPVDLDCLQKAVSHLLTHHDALRLRYVHTTDGAWEQYYGDAAEIDPNPITIEDLSQVPSAEQAAQLEAIAQSVQASLHLTEGTLFKAVYFHLGDDQDGRLLIVVHHLAIDGVSWRILLEDIQNVYRQLANGEEVQLPRKTTSFREWGQQLQQYADSDAMQQEKAYWTARTTDVPSLPTDHAYEVNREADTGQITLSLTAEETKALLQETLAPYRLQINDVLLTALTKAIQRWTGANATAIHLEGHGREDIIKGADLSRTVGWFTSMYPLVLEIGQAKTWGEALKSVKEQLRRIPNKGVGYGILRYLSSDQALVEQLKSQPKPEISFNYLGQFDQAISTASQFEAAPESRGSNVSADSLREHLLDVNGVISGEQLHLTWMYNTTIHEPSTIQVVAEEYMESLREIIAHCRTEEAGGYTPSDFPLAKLDQKALDRYLGTERSIENVYTLSPLQEGMLFHSLYAQEGGDYVVQLALTFTRGLDLQAFEDSWQKVINHHSILRTSFIWDGLDQPHQVVRKQVKINVEQLDWRDISTDEQEAAFADYLEADRSRSFDLTHPPLLRWVLIRVSDEAYRFVWSLHHALLDGWSMPLVFTDWLKAYMAIAGGKEAKLASTAPYANYIAWLQRQSLQEAKAYWRDELRGFHAPTPIGFGKGLETGKQAKTYGVCTVDLNEEITEKLQAFARNQQVTMNTLVQGAWALLLGRYSREEEVLFGATGSGRPADLAGVESMVGLFINTLPIRVPVASEMVLQDWLRGLQQQQITMRQYEYTPLVDIHGWSEISRSVALFESILVFENYPVDESVNNSELSIEIADVKAIEQTNYPLTVVAGPGKQLKLKIQYEQNRFDADTIERVLNQMGLLLESMAKNPEQKLSEITFLSAGEREQVLVEWNQTDAEYPRELCLHEKFELQAQETPDQTAVVYGGEQSLTYAELNLRANQLAHHLQKLGAGPDKLVGICVERSIEMIVGILGVMKAGAAYVPIDPAHPQERIAYMIEDTQTGIVLTQSALADCLPDTGATVICLDSETFAAEPTDTPKSGVTSRNLAYVIYTSGSTGNPKGVMIEHHSAVNAAQALRQAFEVDAASRVLQLTSFSFDVSVGEIMTTLLSGATLFMEHRDALLPGPELNRIIREHRITTILTVPAVVAAMPEDEFPDLRTLVVGGEALSRELVARYAPGRNFLNAYGPTEATIATTFERCIPNGQTPTIGRPLPNMKLYVLDDQLQPAPIGVPGELYIGGVGVARGYWKRPDLTAERFIQNPFGAEGDRLYKTGDLVRYQPNGNLDFIGRIDDQVKVRGYRIELGEIRSALCQHPAVKDAVVMAREDKAGDKRIAAYMINANSDTHTTPDAEELSSWLKQTLPSYMVPSGYVWIDVIPLTVNGKINYRALPAPEWGHTGTDTPYTAPRNPAEEMVANIFGQVLSVSRVGIHDNFFELGGHSLLATQTISRLREAFGVELPLRDLFEHATVAEMSEHITHVLQDAAGLLAAPIVPVSRDEHLPLSFAQQRLWFFDRLMPGSALYNMPSAIRLQGDLDIQAWEKSLQMLIARHESLRTTFSDIKGQAVQVIHSRINWSLTQIDLRDQPAEQQDAEVKCLIAEDAAQPFDLSQGPLMRASLIRLAEQEYVFALNMHHIVSDGWSMGILMGELTALYQAVSKGEVPALPDLPIQYADFALWQREWLTGDILDQQLAYWKDKLQGSEPIRALPTDRPRPAEQTFDGALHITQFPVELQARLQELSREEGSTLFMTLLAAFQLLMNRYTGKEDILVGSPVAGRNRQETEGLIGFFINTLVMRTDLSGEPTFRELLARVRDTALNAYAHQDLPFEKLVDELDVERSLSYSPLFQVVFVLQNTPMQVEELSDLSILPFQSTPDEIMTKFDLTLTMAESPDGLIATFEYNKALFDPATIERMASHFNRLLEEAARQPDRAVNQLPMLQEEEEQQILVEWNETEAPYSLEACVHELFAQAAAEMPDQLAIVASEQSLTYSELDRRSNQLANYLQKQGVGTETLVGICVERSVEMFVGLLGILKAGGAYVPMDPSYPQERLAYMIENASMPIVLTQERLLDQMPEGESMLICLDVDWDLIADESDQAPAVETTADQLAYVIYTSGSTGQPKGVEIEHRSLLNLVNWHQRTYGVTEADRASQIAGTAFDASVWEIWPYLTKGAAMYLPDEDIRLAPEKLRDWLVQSGVTISFLPTPLAENLISLQWPADTALCYMLTGGDKLHSYPAEHLPFALVNHYGPTENTVVATAGTVPVQAGQLTAPHIGRPIDNVSIYVLDDNMQPVPIGVAGELYIGGSSLARGYLNRPDLTAERFLPNPFSSDPAARIYKAGDLVRYLPDGNIEFIGRADHQVSIRGFRVELGEIETALYGYPAIRETVVIAREDVPGTKRLAAYLVLEEGLEVQISELRLYLKEKLPEYMVPSAYVIMDSLPLTPNGKVDRKALPVPDYAQPGLDGEFVAPETFIEKKLAEIWRDVLGVETVGIHDNFFDLGGDSIISIQIVARCNQAGIRLSPKLMFEYQTIAELAGAVGDTVAIHAEQEIITGDLPLTPIQRWFFDQPIGNKHHWNQSVMLTVNDVEPAILQEAIHHLLAHHDSLRLRFFQQDGEWKPYLAEWSDIIPFSTVDLSDVPVDDQARRIEEVSDEAQKSLHLSEGPLLRAVYMDLGEGQEGRLLIVVHHLAVDGVSWRIILEDLQKACTQLLQGKPVQLPMKSTSFKYWAERLAAHAYSDELQEESTYWLGQLTGDLPALPKDHPTGLNREQSATSIVVSLTPEETKSLLQDLPSLYQTQINDVLLTALAEAVYDWTGQRSVLINLEGHGREELFEEVDHSRTVGWFTSMYPVRLDLNEAHSIVNSLQSVKEQLRAIPNKGVGYGILRYLHTELAETMKSLPKAEISFNYMGQLDQTISEASMFGFASEARGDSLSRGSQRAHLIDVGCSVAGGQMHVNISFSEEVYKHETMKALADHYTSFLRNIIEQSQSGQIEGTASKPSDDLSEFGWDESEIADLLDLMGDK
ncbi:non-ribosomal peptide synthase/polyketide synthase [Brevibacillus dissolubilis]|uniref:non-ribosomal peptide synthase/polyketide synthase n=1 Tax=Brevibacillus dissolubilis TaxID=1844116 RepID=UPI001116A5D8|nr:non-ribosomal peptide synthase/polyketide synthase [Brevibacillus dissolubilis]